MKFIKSKRESRRTRIGFSTILIIVLVMAVVLLVPVSSAKYVGNTNFSYTVNSKDAKKPWEYGKDDKTNLNSSLWTVSGTTYTYTGTEPIPNGSKCSVKIDDKVYYFTTSDEMNVGSSFSVNTGNGTVNMVVGPGLEGYTQYGDAFSDTGMFSDKTVQVTTPLSAGSKYYIKIGSKCYCFTPQENIDTKTNEMYLKMSCGRILYNGRNVYRPYRSSLVNGEVYIIGSQYDSVWYALKYDGGTTDKCSVSIINPVKGVTIYDSSGYIEYPLFDVGYFAVPTYSGNDNEIKFKRDGNYFKGGLLGNACLLELNGLVCKGSTSSKGSWSFDGSTKLKNSNGYYMYAAVNNGEVKFIASKTSGDIQLFKQEYVYSGMEFEIKESKTVTLNIEFTRFPVHEVK